MDFSPEITAISTDCLLFPMRFQSFARAQADSAGTTVRLFSLRRARRCLRAAACRFFFFFRRRQAEFRRLRHVAMVASPRLFLMKVAEFPSVRRCVLISLFLRCFCRHFLCFRLLAFAAIPATDDTASMPAGLMP